jgi:hypothetical protein
MLLQSKEGHLPLEKQIYHIYYPNSKKLSPYKQSKNSSSMIKIFLFTKHFQIVC